MEVRSDESKKQYLRDMRVFTDHVGMDPDQLLAERVKDLRSDEVAIRLRADDRLRCFFNENTSAQSSKVHVIAVLKSFYKASGVPLSLKTPKFEHVKINDYIPTREEIQRLVQATDNVRDQALCIGQAENGMRIGGWIRIEWRHIADELNPTTFMPKKIPMAVKIPDALTRTGVTFILDDAAHYLRLWLATFKKLEPNTRIFNIDEDQAECIIRELGIKIGINPGNKGRQPFHSHCFRKRVQTILEDNTKRKTETIPLNWVDMLLDHLPRGAQGEAYSLPSIEQLREAYAIAAPQLRVF